MSLHWSPSYRRACTNESTRIFASQVMFPNLRCDFQGTDICELLKRIWTATEETWQKQSIPLAFWHKSANLALKRHISAPWEPSVTFGKWWRSTGRCCWVMFWNGTWVFWLHMNIFHPLRCWSPTKLWLQSIKHQHQRSIIQIHQMWFNSHQHHNLTSHPSWIYEHSRQQLPKNININIITSIRTVPSTSIRTAPSTSGTNSRSMVSWHPISRATSSRVPPSAPGWASYPPSWRGPSGALFWECLETSLDGRRETRNRNSRGWEPGNLEFPAFLFLFWNICLIVLYSFHDFCETFLDTVRFPVMI